MADLPSSLPPACYDLLAVLDRPRRTPLAIDELPAGTSIEAFRLCEYHGLLERFGVQDYQALAADEAEIILRNDYGSGGVLCLRLTPKGRAYLAEHYLRVQVAPNAELGAQAAKGSGGMISCTDLAQRHNLNSDALGQRLKRWRKKHDAGWIEVAPTERGKNDPQFLYDANAVEPVITDMRWASAKRRS